MQLFVQGRTCESDVDAAVPRELFNPSCMQDLRGAGNVQVSSAGMEASLIDQYG